MKTLYLIGFMGSGKTTIGKMLAKQLQKSFIDTDQYIEKHYGSIPDIFNNQGEKTFRLYENNALKKTTHYEIVATGGGIVENEANYQTMKNNGVIIYLYASFSNIHERLKDDQSRPLWGKGLKENEKLYKKRMPKYEAFSDFKIVTDHKTCEEVVEEILERLNV